MVRLRAFLAGLALLLALPALVPANEFDNPLAKRLDQLRRGFRLRRAIGVKVVDLTTGETLYAHNPTKRFIPASGMKLAIMGASLHYLGPNYRFETTFLVDGPLEDGVVHGNLYIQGSGDPSLTRYEMDYLTRQLAAGGLKEIRGDIVLDDSFFDDQLRGPASYGDILKKGLPIQSALSYNFNLVELRLTPSHAGSRAELHDEGYGYFDVLNRVTTVSRGRPWTRVQKLRRDRVIVRGRVIQGDEEESIGSFIAPDPTRYFASAFVGKLREQGILVPGQIIKGHVDHAELKDVKPLYIHRSARLVEVLAALGKYSNNFSAEQMLKALGAHRWGAPGSFESGARAVGEDGRDVEAPEGKRQGPRQGDTTVRVVRRTVQPQERRDAAPRGDAGKGAGGLLRVTIEMGNQHLRPCRTGTLEKQLHGSPTTSSVTGTLRGSQRGSCGFRRNADQCSQGRGAVGRVIE